MDLNILWFILVTILFAGFFFLEGFDYGVGILLPFLGKDDMERRMVINTVGPVWDGNEVWMITAGGAMFAAFPHWYATMFSGFYLALFLLLVGLILRGVAFEFRSKDHRPGWRSMWDWMIFLGSVIPALLWGVALTNLVKGVPIDGSMNYVGGFWNLLSPYTLVGGLTTLLVFTFHGALFLNLKTEGELLERARRAAAVSGMLAIPALMLLVLMSYGTVTAFSVTPAGSVLWLSAAALALALGLIRSGRQGLAFISSGLSIILATGAIFLGLFPNVMVSSLNPQWNLTIYNASSSPYTLKVMTIVALTLVPVVLLYQGWTYWVFRQRVNTKNLEY